MYGRTSQGTEDSVIRRIKYAINMPHNYGQNKDTHKHLMIRFFHGNTGYVKQTQDYVTCSTLPVLFLIKVLRKVDCLPKYPVQLSVQ
jgi:hypothetical protein